MDLSTLSIPAPPQRAWSEHQLAIFSAIPSTNNLIVEAVAGSGKTTTIIEAMRRATGSSLYLAFNKAIADDLRPRVSGAEVRTLNALGHSIVTKRLPGIKLESWKTANFIRSKLRTDEYAEYGAQAVRLVSLAKGSAFGILNDATRPHFTSLLDQFEIDIPFEHAAKATQVASLAFAHLTNDFASFDFDDQLFLPVFHNWTFPAFDTVFIDEAQDLNAIQHLILERLHARGARIIAVGDTNQAIYGFRGSLTSSMSTLRSTFNMTQFPLSVTYRCDRSIVEQAQSIVPHICARPGAPQGEVLFLDEVNISNIADDVLIVCRNNAPLFDLAMRALRLRRPVRVLSNFTEQLKAFIKSFKTRDLKVLDERLTKWYEAEIQLAEEAGFLGRMQFLTDKYESVQSLYVESSQFDDILAALERFSNATSGPTLATIHKAKGLEAPTTIILNREKLPSNFARTPEALQQESNLLYVAITRAQHSLIYHTQP